MGNSSKRSTAQADNMAKTRCGHKRTWLAGLFPLEMSNFYRRLPIFQGTASFAYDDVMLILSSQARGLGSNLGPLRTTIYLCKAMTDG